MGGLEMSVYRLYLVFHRAYSWVVYLQGVLQAHVN